MRIKPTQPYTTKFIKETHYWELHCDVKGWDKKIYHVTGEYSRNWEFAHALLGAYHAERFIESDNFLSKFTISENS